MRSHRMSNAQVEQPQKLAREWLATHERIIAPRKDGADGGKIGGLWE
jgi:hypothetical protein